MWTYINKSNIENYLMQYPQLQEHFHYLHLIETPDSIFLPRLLYKNYPSDYLKIYNGKEQIEPHKIIINFKGQPRKLQAEALKVVLDNYNKNGFVNGILKLHPGAGKTVLTVLIASKLGLKTCILVDGDKLFQQWIKEIIEFSSLTENDIGIIKQKINVTNKPITIAMVQTLLSKIKNNFNKTIQEIDSARFGLVAYDEVHATSASEQFGRVSVLFRTLNTIGLSATPFKFGSQKILMNNTIGDLIYETKEYDLSPKYYFIHYSSGLGQTKKGRLVNHFNDFIQRRALYNKLLTDSEIYFKVLNKYIQHARSLGHIIFVLCMTKLQVQKISESLDKIGITHRRFYGDEREIDLENDNIVIATYKYAGKGFNMKRLSAMIIATPISGKTSLIQVVGRILRSKEGKLDPIVYHLADRDFPIMTIPDVKKVKDVIKNEFENAQLFDIKEDIS